MVPATHAQHSARVQPILRHAGPCGRRVPCFRAECRAEFGDYATVEVLPNGTRLARCHGARYDAHDLILRAVA